MLDQTNEQIRLVIKDVYCIHLTLNHSLYTVSARKDNLTLIFLNVGTKALHQNKFSIFLVEWDRFLLAAWNGGVIINAYSLKPGGMLFWSTPL